MILNRIKGIYIVLFFALTSSVFFSCNSDIDIPSYIYIENVDFKVRDRERQGTESHNIPFIFLSVDGTEIGYYQLPALVPVIADGQTNITVKPGIRLNGLSQQRVDYPFYTTPTFPVMLSKKKIDTLRPTCTYIDSIKFAFVDNFNDDTQFSTVSGSPLNRGDDEALRFKYLGENNGKYGIVSISPEDSLPFFEIKSSIVTSVPIDCFLEINYWFTEDVEVGIYCHTGNPIQYRNKKVGIVNIRASDASRGETWKKMYINLTDELRIASTEIAMKSFEVYFSGSSTDRKEARFLFDNVKLIYR
ncbi:MAG: hypothetical protein LBH82_02580 [Bacteroidales bacterium]|nr:hypothetical protein [Bacteroidales bacterium]